MSVQIPFSAVRKDAMERTFLELDKMVSPNIVEVGRTRHPFGMDSDGYSTIHFAQYVASHSGQLVSIDNDPTTEPVCRTILELAKVDTATILFVNVPSDELILPVDMPTISLLFLDGPDCDGDKAETSALWHLGCFQCLKSYILPGGLVLVDDCFDAIVPAGKGRDVVPYMLNERYVPLYTGYMWLLRKPE